MQLLNQDRNWFPPADTADEDGLLAVGGDLHPQRLITAYRRGIFPWFNEDEPPLWWCPDPRFVLFPQQLRVSKSMQQVIRRQQFQFRIDGDFHNTIRHCSAIPRRDEAGTWITEEVVKAYTRLHELGLAHSAEAWAGDELVGGLYGIRMGNVFFGESMFSKVSNASKFAFIQMVQHLQQQGVALIDCQVYTQHLESLGACMIPRANFLALLEAHIP